MSAKRVAAACPRRSSPWDPRSAVIDPSLISRRSQTGDTITRREQDMGLPYRARVNEHVLLNLPGFGGGSSYVLSYVEDTTERGLDRDCDDPECTDCPYNFEPHMVLELCSDSYFIRFGFDVDSEAGRANSLHKIDTLLAALRVFRQGLVDEFEPYDRRKRELEASRE